MPIQIGIYDTISGSLYLDVSPRASNVVITTGEHGFGTLTCFVKMALWEAFMLYDRPGIPHVQVSESGVEVYQGRLEDVAIVAGGVRLTALGYWRALSDVPYTALWSTTKVSDWRPVTAQDIAGRNPEMHAIDTNNRLFIALTKNTTYTNLSNVGSVAIFAPDGGNRNINYVTVAYSYVLPVNWSFRLAAYDSAWGSGLVSNITTVGGTSSGTATWDLSATPRAILAVEVFNNTGGASTYAGETGANFVRLTSIRVTSGGSSLGALEIVNGLIAYVNGINSTQLSASTALVGVPGVQLKDEVYQDALPSDILDRLARLGDTSTPVALYEVGVWEDQILAFQKRGNTARTWYVDISALELERTINALANSVYADYQEAAGRTLRTAVSANSDSIARYGLTRRKMVRTPTTDLTQATAARDAAVQDGKDPRPRIAIAFSQIFDASGSLYPLWMPRAWDQIVIRNLPATLSTSLDRIRQFRVIETRYNADNNTLAVTPEGFLPGFLPANGPVFWNLSGPVAGAVGGVGGGHGGGDPYGDGGGVGSAGGTGGGGVGGHGNPRGDPG